MITSSHLATHDIKTSDYKKKFGKDSVSSKEYRESLSRVRSGENNSNYGHKHTAAAKSQISKKKQGSVPWNKGIKFEDTSSQLEAAQRREARYLSGDLTRTSRPVSLETKEKQRVKQIAYATLHHEEMKARSAKGIDTKRKNGTLVGPMAGKTHSDKTKQKLKKIADDRAAQQKQLRFARDVEIISNANIELYAHKNYSIYLCRCLTCKFEFTRTPQCARPRLLRNDMCSNCRPPLYKSGAELEILQFIRDQGFQAWSGDRTIIAPLELDIIIPAKKLAIEYCGLYWHSENAQGKGKEYHRYKYQKCAEAGITLITIFEDEWMLSPNLVKNILKSKLGLAENKLSARQCVLAEVSVPDARKFLKENHIHGYTASQYRVGLYHHDQLVYVMTFTKSNISRANKDTWEIQRMAGLSDTVVRGGASRLFAKFLETYSPNQVISYADLRWFTGESYSNFNMHMEKITPPSYWYFQLPDLTRKHRFSLRKNKNDDPALTEWENRINQGWDRIWDCGHAKWIMNTGAIAAGL
jgi:hypothetical protein